MATHSPSFLLIENPFLQIFEGVHRLNRLRRIAHQPVLRQPEKLTEVPVEFRVVGLEDGQQNIQSSLDFRFQLALIGRNFPTGVTLQLKGDVSGVLASMRMLENDKIARHGRTIFRNRGNSPARSRSYRSSSLLCSEHAKVFLANDLQVGPIGFAQPCQWSARLPAPPGKVPTVSGVFHRFALDSLHRFRWLSLNAVPQQFATEGSDRPAPAPLIGDRVWDLYTLLSVNGSARYVNHKIFELYSENFSELLFGNSTQFSKIFADFYTILVGFYLLFFITYRL